LEQAEYDAWWNSLTAQEQTEFLLKKEQEKEAARLQKAEADELKRIQREQEKSDKLKREFSLYGVNWEAEIVKAESEKTTSSADVKNSFKSKTLGAKTVAALGSLVNSSNEDSQTTTESEVFIAEQSGNKTNNSMEEEASAIGAIVNTASQVAMSEAAFNVGVSASTPAVIAQNPTTPYAGSVIPSNALTAQNVTPNLTPSAFAKAPSSVTQFAPVATDYVPVFMSEEPITNFDNVAGVYYIPALW
ncbi:MAG TPA: hypothetical protein V6C96_02925, partial [Vampirovibrionales bacterium]